CVGEIVEDRAEIAVEARGRGLALRLLRLVELLQRDVDLGHVLVELRRNDERLALLELCDRALAVLELRERGRALRVLRAPIAAGRHPHRERLRPVLVRMLLRVPARQVPDEPAAERLWAVGLAVRLRDRAEELHPVLA